MGNQAKIITTGLIALCLLSGILLLYFGISGTIKIHEESKNFEHTEGYLIDYSLYLKGKYYRTNNNITSDTYRLIYKYTVNGQEYTVSTEYGTSFIPEKGSKQEIRYNPNNPGEAIIVGRNNNNILIFAGILFTGVPLPFVLSFLFAKGRFHKVSFDIMGTLMGLLFFILGCGAVYLITGQNSIKGVFEYLSSSFQLALLIPILFIGIGAYILIRSLFFSKKTDIYIDENTGLK